MSLEAEVGIKRQRIEALMQQHHLAGLLLGRNSSVSWGLAGGEAHVAINSETASAALLYTPQRDYLLADAIEMPRLQAEVLPGLPFEPVTFPWYEPDRRQQLIIELTHGGAIGSDIATPDMRNMIAAMTALRYQLTQEEQNRLRDLAARAGAAIETTAGEIAPGMQEYAIAGLLAEECFLRDITPILLLVGTDDRVERFRHPLPTSKPLERYAMLVLSARRWGLVANVTRLIHFGPIPADLQQRAAACARIDAAMIAATRPGMAVSGMFSQIQAAYATEGYPDHWGMHHQGGATGYASREWLATPDSVEKMHVGQAFAWNPSLPGVKCEDTILLQDDGVEILTATPQWPKQAVQSGAVTVERPLILEVD